LCKVVWFDLVQQKRYTSSKILVVVTQVCPSFLPDLINMRCLALTLNKSLQLFSIQRMMMMMMMMMLLQVDLYRPTGDDITEEDDVSTVVPTNEPKPLDVIEYNIKLLMTNKQDNSDSELQQATMTVLH
jgi:hypothetical protein